MATNKPDASALIRFILEQGPKELLDGLTLIGLMVFDEEGNADFATTFTRITKEEMDHRITRMAVAMLDRSKFVEVQPIIREPKNADS